MKNSFFARLKFFTLIIMLVGINAMAFAQGTLNPDDPNSYVDPANTNPLLVGLTMLLAFFSGKFPGLKNINITWLRSAVVAIVVVAGAATFKFGFFTKETVQFVLETVLPNFAYSGLAYEAIRTVLKFFGIELKSLKPGGTAVKPAAKAV